MGSFEISAERRMKELETLFLRGPYNSASLKESAAFRYTMYSGHEKEVDFFLQIFIFRMKFVYFVTVFIHKMYS